MSDAYGQQLDRDTAPERPAFRSELWSTLVDEWNGIETATLASPVVDLAAARRRSAMWATFIAAAAAVAVIGVIAVNRPAATIRVTPGTDDRLEASPGSVASVDISSGATSEPDPNAASDVPRPIDPSSTMSTQLGNAASTTTDAVPGSSTSASTTAATAPTSTIEQTAPAGSSEPASAAEGAWPTYESTGRGARPSPAATSTWSIPGSTMHRLTDFVSAGDFAGQWPDPAQSTFEQWFASSDFTQVLRINTAPSQVSAEDLASDDPTTGWTITPAAAMARDFARIDSLAVRGQLTLWSVGVPTDDLIRIVRGVTRRPDGRAGWDLTYDAGLEPVWEDWDAADTRWLQWESPTGPTAEVVSGVSALTNIWWAPTESLPEIIRDGGRTVVIRSNDTLVIDRPLDGSAGGVAAVRTVSDDRMELMELVDSLTWTTDAAVYDAIPKRVARPGEDGCHSLFC